MVARENFGPRVAQIAAVALMVDYVVTVAVRTRPAARRSCPRSRRWPGRWDTATLLLIAVAATLLRLREPARRPENGRVFALPTYLFSASVGS